MLKNGCWFTIFVGLGGIVIVTILMLVYLMVVLPPPQAHVDVWTTPPGQVLQLPTAVPTGGAAYQPHTPAQVTFIAKDPIRGFNDCNVYGFRGIVWAANQDSLAGANVVVWQADGRLTAIETTDVSGIYEIEWTEPPVTAKYWVQLYQNDRPTSDPLPLDITPDCEQGYQVYQIDWQEVTN